MGYDSSYYPPPNISRKELEHFLILLDFEKQPLSDFDKEHKARRFHYAFPEPYKSYQGTLFTTLQEKEGLVVCGRNNIWCSKLDISIHNKTLRELKRRFGGYFTSDYGKNRYFPEEGRNNREKDEAGCFIEVERALSQLKNVALLEMHLMDSTMKVQRGHFIYMNSFHPHVILANLLISYLLSIIESFFRNTYVALLTYSEKKQDILKGTQFRPSDLIDVSTGALRIEEAFANSLNFQNAKSICENFDRLDQRLGIRQTLTYTPKRKESFEKFIERIANQRHRFLHQNVFTLDYDLDALKKDAHFCKIVILSTYKSITAKKNWHYEEPY